MRYYSHCRPVAPGTFPRFRDNAVVDIHNFDDRKYVKEIDDTAWGWVEYEFEINEITADLYDLMKGGEVKDDLKKS